MADAVFKKLLLLLGQEHSAEVRAAAALVLGEVGNRDAAIAQSLCDALDDPEATVRAQVLGAIGKLRVDRALPHLLDRVQSGGLEAEWAAQAAAALGVKATHALQELMSQVAPGLKRRIAGALAAGGTASAETAAVDVLLDNDPHVVDAAARSLISKVPTLGASHRRALTDHILELLGRKRKIAMAAHAESALVRLLAALGDSRGETMFWIRIEPPHPPELRSAALQALGMLPLPTNRDKVKRLLHCAADADFRVAAPALIILKGATVSDRALDDWLPLLHASDPAARRFAIDKLGAKDTPAVAEALMSQLDHPDRGLREVALTSLAKLSHGRETLARHLLAAETPDRAWTLARVQAPFAPEYSSAVRNKIFATTCAYLEAGDRRTEPLLFLLREADKDWRDRLEERALALRKKKEYAAALTYLRLLGRDPACGEAIRFELAACGLKLSEHDLDFETRAADPALEQFAGLMRRHDSDLAAWTAKAKWLEAADLFYLGFHFVEGARAEKEFGANVLRLLLQRFPRSKQAKLAKNKLRSQGLK
jgi:hypothetical protein